MNDRIREQTGGIPAWFIILMLVGPSLTIGIAGISSINRAADKVVESITVPSGECTREISEVDAEVERLLGLISDMQAKESAYQDHMLTVLPHVGEISKALSGIKEALEEVTAPARYLKQRKEKTGEDE